MEYAKANTSVLDSFVSVVVPVRNSPVRIARCIEAILDQTYPKDRFEILVVDNGSTDETPDVIRKYPVRYLAENSVQSPYAARNKAIIVAKGEIIAMIDANCFASPLWLERGVKKIIEEKADLLGGKVTFIFLGGKKTTAEMFDSISNVKMKESVENRGVAKGGNLFVRKKVFDSIGLFPGNVRSGMDVMWTGKATRAGFKIVYSEEAEVSYPARCFWPLLKKCHRVGRGQANIWQDNKVTFINKIKRILTGFRPVPSSFIRGNIQKRGSKDMNQKFWRMWFVAWMCSIATNFGRIDFLCTANSGLTKKPPVDFINS